MKKLCWNIVPCPTQEPKEGKERDYHTIHPSRCDKHGKGKKMLLPVRRHSLETALGSNVKLDVPLQKDQIKTDTLPKKIPRRNPKRNKSTLEVSITSSKRTRVDTRN